MAFAQALLIFFSVLIFISVLRFVCKLHNLKAFFQKNWHVFRIIVKVIHNMHRFHYYATNALIHNGGTLMLRGPWFPNMNMLVTADPSDVHYILSKNFSNYPKGEKFRKMFDIFGDGIFNADGHLWEIHRKTTLSLLRHSDFQSMLEMIVWDKVENGLLPVIESVLKVGMDMDLQDVFQRFTFDTMCKLLLDHDLKSLSLNFPSIPCEKAMPHVEEAMFYRHIYPPSLWKLQQLLRIGNEKKLSDSWKTIDEFIYEYLTRKQNESRSKYDENEAFGLLASLMSEFEGKSNEFLRDTIVSLIGAGRETTSTSLSWFFYLLAKNPIEEEKLRHEIYKNLEANKRWTSKQLDQLVYLHGALCETLRLFPPIPFNHKCPLSPDILPSGHKVNQNTKIILYFYAMERMKTIWGDDCLKFKPERWIRKEGGLKHEPSYKFPAFNAA